MWWSGKNKGQAKSLLFGRASVFIDRQFQRVSIRLNDKLATLSPKQRKTLFLGLLSVLSIAGLICAIPGIYILPVSSIPAVQSSPPPIMQSDNGAQTRYSRADSIQVAGFRKILDSMRGSEEGRRQIEFFERQAPGLLDSLLEVSNSLNRYKQ